MLHDCQYSPVLTLTNIKMQIFLAIDGLRVITDQGSCPQMKQLEDTSRNQMYYYISN